MTEPTTTEPTHAGGLILRDAPGGREYLIVTSSSGMGWVLPKGVIDPGEEPDEAALREVEEEAAVVCEIVVELGDVDIAKPWGDVLTRFYLMRVLGTVRMTEDRELRWVDADTARQLLSSPGARAMIDRAEARLG